MTGVESAVATGLDAVALLGIMAEVSTAVVGMQSDPSGAFLSFPLTPLPFRADDLEFTTLTDPERARAFAEFSDLVNRLPGTSTVWNPVRPGRFWDVYGEVLRADLAEDVLTPQQQASYDESLGVLYDVAANGTRTASARLQSYIAYQKQWLEAAAAVAKARRDGADDIDVLVEARDLVALQWNDLGFRQVIDDARHVVESIRAASPATVWSGYRRNFDPADPTQFQSSPVDGLRYMPSPFTPTGAVRPEAPWPRLTLDRAQLSALASSDQVPDGLRQQLMDLSSSSAVSRVSFEYTVVEITRGWVELSMFASRVWRFPPGGAPLYDPDTPEDAWRCPAYVSGVVLARNIAVESDQADTSPMGPLDVLAVRRMGVWDDANGVVDPDRLRLARRDLETVAVPFRPLLETIRPSATLEATEALPESFDGPTTVVFDRLLATDTGPAADMPSQAPQDVVLVLAFLCRRLPKAPDPDPSLRFPGDAAKPVTVHIVRSGESLALIAKKFYGDGEQWHRIYDENRTVIGPDPNRIVAGQALRIPS